MTKDITKYNERNLSKAVELVVDLSPFFSGYNLRIKSDNGKINNWSLINKQDVPKRIREEVLEVYRKLGKPSCNIRITSRGTTLVDCLIDNEEDTILLKF